MLLCGLQGDGNESGVEASSYSSVTARAQVFDSGAFMW